MKAARRKNRSDNGRIVVGHLRTQGISDEGLWTYALADARDCNRFAALRWLVEAGIQCPRELRDQYADAIERTGFYRRRKRAPNKHNGITRSQLREDWEKFCGEWKGAHPEIAPPVGKWIATFDVPPVTRQF